MFGSGNGRLTSSQKQEAAAEFPANGFSDLLNLVGTKIAVTTADAKVDPVGACVGARGARVKSIVRELNGEKIDIIPFKADPREMVLEALKPAVPRSIQLDE